MIRKLTFLVGVGAGYVLGAKAGEERYRQIMTKAREFAGMPAVQEATSTFSAAASTVVEKATDKAKETVEGLVDLNGSATPPPAPATVTVKTPASTVPGVPRS